MTHFNRSLSMTHFDLAKDTKYTRQANRNEEWFAGR